MKFKFTHEKNAHHEIIGILCSKDKFSEEDTINSCIEWKNQHPKELVNELNTRIEILVHNFNKKFKELDHETTIQKCL